MVNDGLLFTVSLSCSPLFVYDIYMKDFFSLKLLSSGNHHSDIIISIKDDLTESKNPLIILIKAKEQRQK